MKFVQFSILLGLLVLKESSAQFSKAEKNLILAQHNAVRSQIARGVYVAKGGKKVPAASNMLKMVWDDKLASYAQKWANTKPKGHSKSGVTRFNAGENIYWSYGGTKNFTKAASQSVQLWADEYKKVGFASNVMSSQLFNSGVGHATQVSWAKTYKLGCGAFNYKENNMLKTVVVCQYQPPGNYMKATIFETGKTCSKCPAKTKCEKKTGLCV